MGKLKWICFAVFGACVTWLLAAHTWGFLYGLGVHPYPESSSTPWTYQLWSGFLPALAIISLFGGITAHFKSINCHVHGCWRIGKYPMAGGQFKVCRPHSHHPEKITHAYILAAHEEHVRCTPSFTKLEPAGFSSSPACSTCCSGSSSATPQEPGLTTESIVPPVTPPPPAAT